MKRIIVLCLLVAASAHADAPSIDIVRVLCIDGRLAGVVLRVTEPGLHGIRWGADICAGET